MAPAGLELADAQRDARAVVIDERHLAFGVGVGPVAPESSNSIVRPQRFPCVVFVRVLETRLTIEELRDLVIEGGIELAARRDGPCRSIP